MWPADLRAKVHSRWELLEYLAASKIRTERREQREQEEKTVAEQQAEALAALHK